MGSGSYATILDSSYNRGYSTGTTDMSLSYFPQPILTSEISFGDIVYTANPIGDDPLWNFGHIVNFNLELFGCENYKIDESKLVSLFYICSRRNMMIRQLLYYCIII